MCCGSDRTLDVKMAAETNLSITSIAGLTNNPNQTITGTGAVGATVKVLDGTTLLGTTVVGSDGTWSEVVALSGEGAHSISAQSVGSPSVLSTLMNFDGSNGWSPMSGLVSDGSGNLYGTTFGAVNGGDLASKGTVYKLSGANYQTFTTLVNFDGTNGANPMAGLAVDGAGTLYGTTTNGGIYGAGTVFELSGSDHQNFTVLVNFDDANGANINGSGPYGGLVSDNVGNLYGTTRNGGAGAGGTIFELSGSNHQIFTTLVSFLNGRNPESGLSSDGEGNLYGTTTNGGRYNEGTVFELSGADHQTLTTLLDFNRYERIWPQTNVISDQEGHLYGTTAGGG